MTVRKTVGILAHVDAGKTTLSEQLLYQAGALRALGRKGNTFLDSNQLEKSRGITIYMGLAEFSWGDSQFTLLDTPGHVDFSSEMERAVSVLDCAVVVVSCVDGVQAHTETIWHILLKAHVPVLFFLNKADRPGACPERTLDNLRTQLGAPAAFYQESEECAAFLAERDDELMERYLAEDMDRRAWRKAVRRLFLSGGFCPVFCGSALTGEGIKELLNGLDALAQAKEDGFSIRPFRVRYDSKGVRLTFLKVIGGEIQAKQEIFGEKADELRIYNGDKFRSVQKAEAGSICAAVGLTAKIQNDSQCPPLLTVSVYPDGQTELYKMQRAIRILAEEDPSLEASLEGESCQIHVMGEMQLEILADTLKQRYDVSVRFGEAQICYRETIAKPVIGLGHYEPLRHYAEVHLRLSPGERGSGIVFDSACSADVLPASYQSLVRTHVFEKEHRGILTCSPLTDIKITLLTGRAHEKHTEGGDFREATYRAIRQGLEQAEAILLEPWYSFRISCPEDVAGKLLSDLTLKSCVFEPEEAGNGRFAVKGKGPAACLMGYGAAFASFTHGLGRISLCYCEYAPCHNAQDVISRIGYDKTRDMVNTSTSIFCKKGAGFPVKWDEVPNYIHCKDL